MSDRGSKFGDFLTGLLVGGAVGYGIALLFAPMSGEETRQMLTDRGRELSSMAKDRVQSTVDKTEKLVAEGRERVNATVGDTRNRIDDKVSDLKDRGDSVLSDARVEVSERLHQAADQVDPTSPTGKSEQG